ncbi:MAG: signal transduction histidine kinase [Paraglaciecola sp.]|jgi:signal transduction histidine kinase
MVRHFFSFYLMLLAVVFIHQVVGVFASDLWMHEAIVQDKINDDVGLFHLLEQLHQNLDEQQFKEVVNSYPKSSNMPIQLLDGKPFHSLYPIFDRNNIHVKQPSINVAFYKFKNADLVARLGPVRTYQPLINMDKVYQNSVFILVGLSVLLWMFKLQRKLNRLNSAATQFGGGDFTFRVSEAGRHQVGRLNKSFNKMAQRIEALVKANKSLTNAVAHELRTPITRLRFQLDMMYEESDNDLRKEYMYGMSDDVNELTELVDEILTFARFESEALSLNLQANPLDESLRRVIQARHFDSHLKLTYDDSWLGDEEKDNYLPFDAKNLERAIGNLLSNAQKYAVHHIQIHVVKTKDKCTIYVDDDGPGIPEQERSDIFAPFKRLDNSRTRATGGYGIGLAIVKQIAQGHGGEVSIDDAPLGGARFIVSWPIGGPVGI